MTLQSLLVLFGYQLLDRMTIRGLDARIDAETKQQRQDIADKVDAALALIAKYAPVRFDCLRRDMKRLFIGPTAYRAVWISELAMCLVRREYAQDQATAPARLALTLVHEGTHARLDRAGFGDGESVRARIEAACVQAEIIFASRLPAADELTAAAILRRNRDSDFFSDASERARIFAQLDQLGWEGKLAKWLNRHIPYLFRPRQRKTRRRRPSNER